MAILRSLAIGALAATQAGALALEVESERVQVGGTQENALAALAGTRVQDDVVTTHNLTICNAYADRKPLSAYTVNTRAKLTEEPIPYRACKKISLQLEEGERVDFRLGGLSVGTFRASGLPYVSSNLLMIPYHANNDTMTAAIASHMFSQGDERAQVAVLDAYVGKRGSMKVEQAGKRSKQSAELKSGQLLKLKAGTYNFVLMDDNGKTMKTVMLEAQPYASYVVMHVGSEPDGTPVVSTWEHEQLLVSSSIGGVGSSSNLEVAFSASLRAGLGLFAAAAAFAAAMA